MLKWGDKLGWIMIACILLTIAAVIWAMNINKKNEALETKLAAKELTILYKNVYILELEKELSDLRQSYTPQNTFYQSEEIKAAIKYAMVKSHPDNGGSQDDFIKFRKLYQDVSR